MSTGRKSYLTSSDRSITSTIGDKYDRTSSRVQRITEPIFEEDERNPNDDSTKNSQRERGDDESDDLNLATFSDDSDDNAVFGIEDDDDEETSVISSTSAVISLNRPPPSNVQNEDGDDDEDNVHNEESSVISATSAFVSLSKPSSILSRPSSRVKQRNASFSSKQSLQQRNSSFGSKQSTPPINVARQATPSLQQRNNSFSSKQSIPAIDVTRQATPSLQQRNNSFSSKQSIPAIDVTRQATPAGRLPSKPTASQASRNFKGSALSNILSKDSFSTYDSQDLYALSMTDGSYTTSKEKEFIRKAQSSKISRMRTGNSINSMDFSCGSSVDSQEMYAMMMAYSTTNSTEEVELQHANHMKRLAMEKKAAAEYAEANADLKKARWTEKETAKRNAIKAEMEAKQAAEKQAAAKWGLLRKAETAERELEAAREAELKAEAEAEKEFQRKLELEATAEAEAELARNIQKHREYEERQRELEEEVEMAHRSKTSNMMKLAEKSPYFRPFNWNGGGSTVKSKKNLLHQFSDDSDYSSDSDNYNSATEPGEDETNYFDGKTEQTGRTGLTSGTGRTGRTGYTDGDDFDDEDGDFGDSVRDEDGTMMLGDLNVVTGKADDRTIKSNVSSMSGSDDEGGDGENGNQTKATIPITDEYQEEDKGAPKKKKVVMFSKGLGKGKQKEATNKPVISKVTRKRLTKGTTTTKTTKHMKNTPMKAKKAAPKKRKVGNQMITIRQRGRRGVDDIVPTKTDPNAKVMRVCKLTSKGYISAEFTSIDPRNTPLHIACLTHYPEKFILDHLMRTDKKTEDYIFVENSSGELPIHYAVMDRQGVPSKILEALLNEFPESVEHANVDGSLPIHVACEVGAPSLYAIKRLCEVWPGSVMIQNDLQVPLHEDDEEDEMEKQIESRGMLSCFYDNFGLDWFGGNELMEIEDYETGWTPLHLASLNGAEPDVIEVLLDTNPNCMALKTNKGRTALECAKWCIINAIINDVAVTKLQNTFTSIQIMQSYDRELKIKEELTLKTGLVNAALENSDIYGQLWAKTIELLPGQQTENEKRAAAEAINEDEVGLTNLHRVILSKSPPEEVQTILEENPECLDITTTHDRTPMECAKHIIIKGLLLGHLVSDLTNTFVSLEVMQAFEDQREDHHELDASEAISKSVANRFKEIGAPKFGSKMDNYNYTKKFVEMEESDLGRFVTADSDSAIQPHEYFPPANLSHVNLRITIPVGFRRFRRAFLHVKENFLADTVLDKGLGYSE